MINTYNLFAVPVVHGKFIVSTNIHQKILNFVDKNYSVSEEKISVLMVFKPMKILMVNKNYIKS